MRNISSLFLALILLLVSFTACQSSQSTDSLLQEVALIEDRLQARIGIAVSDTHSGRDWQVNADDRFPLVSTFKTVACAALLVRTDEASLQLDQRVIIDEADLVYYSPVMKDRTGPAGVSLKEACEATLHTSDNTAANIVLNAIGGPAALTKFFRSIGDIQSRLDRYETALNEAKIGDERDTTTPNAMVATLKKLLIDDDVLSPNSQSQLKNWLMGNQVGDALLRAGIPSTWLIADRTGAGENGTRAITAVMWPPQRSPIIVAIYITETDASFSERNDAIAQIGSAIAAAIE